MRTSLFVAGITAAALLAPWGAANATTVSANKMTADNTFTAFIATAADNSDGVQIFQDNDGSVTGWQTFESFSSALTPGVVNYLHIRVDNEAGGTFNGTAPNFGGNPGALLGQFELSDAAFAFANGLQVLLSDTENWVVSDSGFGVDLETPIALGANDGTFIWNVNGNGGDPFADVSTAAQFIWSDNFCTGCSAFFTAAITPTRAGDVPAPASMALFAAGLLGLGVARRRSRRA